MEFVGLLVVIGCRGRLVAIPLVLAQWLLVRRATLELALGDYMLGAAARAPPMVLAQPELLPAVASPLEVTEEMWGRGAVGYASVV